MQDMGIHVLFQGNNLSRIFTGLGTTIAIAAIAVFISMILGTIFGIIMTSKKSWVRWLSRVYLECIRIMPQLVLLFLVYFGLARTFNINISGFTSAFFTRSHASRRETWVET